MDPADRANDTIDADMERRKVELWRAASIRAKSGRGECGCGEPISDLRKNMGANRCIDCQETHELSK